MTYASDYAKGIYKTKFNKENQYTGKKEAGGVGHFSSKTGQLEREMLYTTLGWIQSALWMSSFMYLWANGLPHYNKCDLRLLLLLLLLPLLLLLLTSVPALAASSRAATTSTTPGRSAT